MGRYGDLLIGRLDRAVEWPLRDERDVWKTLRKWIAFRESDRDQLKVLANWTDNNRRYMVDPLAPRINDAFASVVAGREPKVRAPAEGDQGRVDDIRDSIRFASEFRRAIDTSSSEGEVWYRPVTNIGLSDFPGLEWYSRTAVLPQWAGHQLGAAAFINRYDRDGEHAVYRHFEIHEHFEIRNVLYRGNDTQLGERIGLGAIDETAELAQEWIHELPIMVGRIPNKLGADPTLGISDYDGIEDILLGLNEALTIGHENMRLTAKRRVVVPESALDEHGELPAGKEVLPLESVEDKMGGATPSASPFKVLEYSFDADALIKWQDSEAVKALSRVGITPQFVGAPVGQEGYAQSGVAYRLRLIPTINASEDKARFVDDEMPRVWWLLREIDSMPNDGGDGPGFGRNWQNKNDPIAVELGDPLPEDRAEGTTRRAQAVDSEIMSRETAIREDHPDWSEEQIADELKRIDDDVKKRRPASSNLFGRPAPAEGDSTDPARSEGDPEAQPSDAAPGDVATEQ